MCEQNAKSVLSSEAFLSIDRLTAANSTSCDSGWHWNNDWHKCVQDTTHCDSGWHWDSHRQKCVQDDSHCNSGYHWDSHWQKCVQDQSNDWCPEVRPFSISCLAFIAYLLFHQRHHWNGYSCEADVKEGDCRQGMR